MIKIAICDDELVFIKQVQVLLNHILSDKNIIFSVNYFLSGEELCKSLDNGFTYDIVFLDILMSGINGIDVGLRLNQSNNKKSILIYVSSYDTRAKEVFCVNAHRFLSKPIEIQLFEEALISACEILDRSLKKVFSFICSDGHVKLPLYNILYFEVVQSHRVDVITHKDNYTFYGKLADVQSELLADDFLRIHQSYLINYDYIKNITYENVTMENDVLLWISGPRRKEIRKIYKETKQRRNNKWQ